MSPAAIPIGIGRFWRINRPQTTFGWCNIKAGCCLEAAAQEIKSVPIVNMEDFRESMIAVESIVGFSY
jgi:hypothetical protein